MAVPSDLMTGIVKRLTSAQQPGGSLAVAAAVVVLREDAHDLATQIQKSANQYGMILLVGQVPFDNRSPIQGASIEGLIHTAVAIREDPMFWRKNNPDGSARPMAQDLAWTIVRLLHGFVIPGFLYLKAPKAQFIPDKKVQLFEIPIETLLIAPTLKN